MHYKHYPTTDKKRLHAILTAHQACKLKLHGITLTLISNAEAGFFLGWFQNQLPGFQQQRQLIFSPHMRQKADNIIGKLWHEIESKLSHLPETQRQSYARNWGINYIDVRFKRSDLFSPATPMAKKLQPLPLFQPFQPFSL